MKLRWRGWVRFLFSLPMIFKNDLPIQSYDFAYGSRSFFFWISWFLVIILTISTCSHSIYALSFSALLLRHSSWWCLWPTRCPARCFAIGLLPTLFRWPNPWSSRWVMSSKTGDFNQNNFNISFYCVFKCGRSIKCSHPRLLDSLYRWLSLIFFYTTVLIDL